MDIKKSYVELINEKLNNDQIVIDSVMLKCMSNKEQEVYKLYLLFLDTISLGMNKIIRNNDTLKSISDENLNLVNFHMRRGLIYASHRWFRSYSGTLYLTDYNISRMKSMRNEFIKSIERRNKVTLFIHNQKEFFKSLSKEKIEKQSV